MATPTLALTCLGKIGGAVLGKIGEYLVAPIGRQFTYMCCFNSNIKELETQLQELETTRQGVQMGVDDTHRKMRVVGPAVEAWLTRANEVTLDVKGVTQDKAKVNEGCLNGWCPNLKLRYSLGRKAVKTTKVVVDHQVAGVQYTKSSYSPPPVSMEVIPNKDFTEFESRSLIREEIIMALMHDEINLIGICGLPGVGKTKMMQEVKKRATEEKLFDEFAFVVVGQYPDLTKIQKCIADVFGIADMGKHDAASTRACILRKRLLQDNKKILVVLDDVWAEFDLLDMGIPLGGSNKNFKMLYTSRIRHLWHDVQIKKEISLELLSKDEAWQLFKEKAGNLVDAPDLQPIAKQIVDECGRLPLALVIIGSTLLKKSGGNSTKYIWEEMLDRLTCPSGTPADKHLLLSLETSYNYVEDEEAKLLFLLCCLFEEDQYISIEHLARYGLGLSLFRGIHETRKVRRRVIALVDDLMSHYLLLDTGFYGHVKLHDVVRDMGISIASRDSSLVSHGNISEWPKEDTYKDFTSISVISQEIMEFHEGFRSPSLQFLLLRFKNHDEMPCNFFDGIKILRVLVLIGYFMGPSVYLRNCSLRYLRTLCLLNLNATLDNLSGIGDLEDLEILSLIGCSIDELPTEIGKLAKLRLLDLTRCQLRRIPPGVISRLVGLEELYMIDCGFVDWEGEGNEEGINASLMEFDSLSKLNTLEVRIIDAAFLPKIPIFSKLTKFLIEIENPFRCLDWRFRRPKPNYLAISSLRPIRSDYGGLNSLLRRTECLALQGKGTSDLVRELSVEGPEGLQLLKNLFISLCATPEYLANTMNSPPQLNVTAPAVFPVLETLYLYQLDNLREICHGPVPPSSFGKLTSLTVERCFAVEEVIRNDRGEDAHMATKTIEFPKLESLELCGLPSLVGFCRGVDKIHFPELKELKVEEVGLLSLFPEEVSLPNLEKLQLFWLQNLETLGDGPISFGSLFKLKQISVRLCKKLTCVFPSQWLPMLRDLEKLTVELEGVDASEPNIDILPPVDVTLSYLPKLNYISKRDPVVFKNIHTLDIYECDSLIYVFAPTMTKSIPQLRRLHISSCVVLSRIVAEENGLGESSVDEVEFPQLARLELKILPNLVSFFPKVTTTPQPLFNGKVAIPSLKYLVLQQLKNSSDVWFSELPTSSVSKLKELTVIDCENLKNMFHPSMVEALANLEILVIRNCSKMEAVVDSEEKGQGRKIDKAMFPQLREMELDSLPNLRMFCHFTCPLEFPVLSQMDIRDCPSLDAFSLGHLSVPKLCSLGTSSKDILNHFIRFTKEQDHLVVPELPAVPEMRESKEPEIKEGMDGTLLSGDVHESNPSDKAYIDDALHCNEEMPSPSNSKVNTEGCKSGSSEHLDTIPIGCEGYFGLEVNDDGIMPRGNEMPVNDEDARTVSDLQAYIATLEREMKERDETHALEIQKKDEEIAGMNEKILSLLADNGKIWDELEENIVHEVTQSAKPISKAKQHSPGTHLKGKYRKGTKKEEFVYPEKRKRIEPVAFDEGVSSKDAINVDTFVEKPDSKPVEIKGLKKNLVYRLMASKDKDKIDRLWKEVTSSTSIWCGTIVRCSVFVEDLQCLLIETALNGNVIDAYAEYLLMDQETRVSDLMKQRGDGDYTQGGVGPTSYAFTSSFLALIAGKTHEYRNEILGHMMRNTSTYRYLFFPIHNHFHWTLLILDNEEGTWKFYNSLCPKTGVDHNLESAKIVKNAIDNYFKGNSGGLFYTKDCQQIQHEQAPQQVPDSLDCGIIVCYIIRQYFRNETVETKLPKVECRMLRADIIHAFLNDEANSWTPQHALEDEGHKANNSTKQAVRAAGAEQKQAGKRKKK